MGAVLLASPGTLLVLILVLALGAFLGMSVEKYWSRIERAEKRAYWEQRRSQRKTRSDRVTGKVVPVIAPAERAPTDAAAQLRIVSKARFSQRPLLNRPEAKVFTALDAAVIARNPGWQVMAQVSLGEFLASPNEEAYACVNSKRVDFALMDEQCCVRHALEYQGSGHHLNDSTAARDAVKKEALRRAGIGYHEVVAGHTTPSELRALVEKLVPGQV